MAKLNDKEELIIKSKILSILLTLTGWKEMKGLGFTCTTAISQKPFPTVNVSDDCILYFTPSYNNDYRLNAEFVSRGENCATGHVDFDRDLSIEALTPIITEYIVSIEKNVLSSFACRHANQSLHLRKNVTPVAKPKEEKPEVKPEEKPIKDTICVRDEAKEDRFFEALEETPLGAKLVEESDANLISLRVIKYTSANFVLDGEFSAEAILELARAIKLTNLTVRNV
jgi:hypothetical protein